MLFAVAVWLWLKPAGAQSCQGFLDRVVRQRVAIAVTAAADDRERQQKVAKQKGRSTHLRIVLIIIVELYLLLAGLEIAKVIFVLSLLASFAIEDDLVSNT